MTFPMRVRACALIIGDDRILLIEFEDEHGVHYNLPAGGVKPNESAREAVKREAKEEASIDVEVGQLALVYEYIPHLSANKYGEIPSLQLIFDCKIKDGSIPLLPQNPDPNQIGVKWVGLNELPKITLYPNITEQIVNYANSPKNIDFIEEHLLEMKLGSNPQIS